MSWMDWIERILYIIAVILIGMVIGAQWSMRDTRIELNELRKKVVFLEKIKINDKGDIIVIEKGDR